MEEETRSPALVRRDRIRAAVASATPRYITPTELQVLQATVERLLELELALADPAAAAPAAGALRG